MTKGDTRRDGGKLITAGHSTTIEGLNDFYNQILSGWPEITSVRFGEIQVGRGVNSTTARGQPGDRRGFSFRMTRLDTAPGGNIVLGVRCQASRGRSHQEVILRSNDLPALLTRLEQEGYKKRE